MHTGKSIIGQSWASQTLKFRSTQLSKQAFSLSPSPIYLFFLPEFEFKDPETWPVHHAHQLRQGKYVFIFVA
jgi:hypothetical protein